MKNIAKFLAAGFLAVLVLLLMGADDEGCNGPQAVSSSGVKKTSVKVVTGSDGLTVEQRNVGRRLEIDNKPGSIKHLYIISAYSGQVLIYSTVQGKVTSSGKRLTPTATMGGGYNTNSYFNVDMGGTTIQTTEVLQDDGTYGSSVDYLYWWDTKGVFHQQYVTGGMILHVSDQPVAVKNVVINMEITGAGEP
jgi:hypothetical protein